MDYLKKYSCLLFFCLGSALIFTGETAPKDQPLEFTFGAVFFAVGVALLAFGWKRA